jgi:class 3 adenylate cyclase
MTHGEPLRLGVLDLPGPYREEALAGDGKASSDQRVPATVLFTDIVNSTLRLVDKGELAWLDTIDRYEALVGRLLLQFSGRLIRSLGDGTLATFASADTAVAFALALRAQARQLGLELRIGLHTGEVYFRGSDVSGLAVHIAARVEGCAGADEILVSEQVTDSISKASVGLADLGSRELRGLPGEWRLYGLVG